ncbi:hypothetical protein F889_00316 [Acinetobacter colistiniresistens]|uniref:HTH lysR-type domain-containing protein n=2 Tax=Acinetobacter colistiniresistens TaxID=280145 RepID=N9RBB5_9GAMM|nr:hypothetical protein F889_00316 [Acinetobacter colistiniresistens]
MFDDLAIFIHIAKAGSLNQAAQDLSIPPSTLTRRLQILEKNLACKLLHRNTRGIQLTPEGQQYFERCQPLIESLKQTTNELYHHIQKPVGTVRIIAPIDLANTFLLDFWSIFLKKYPDINIELMLNNNKEHLLTTGADLAIRVGEQQDSSYTQKYLYSLKTMLVASPQYINTHPAIQSPDDLKDHAWIIAEPLLTLTLLKDGLERTVHLNDFRIRISNEMQICRKLAIDGFGLSYLPETQYHEPLEKGLLQCVLSHWQPPVRGIYAIWPTQRLLPNRVKVVIDELSHYLQKS